MSRLSALREFGYLTTLHAQGFSCPQPFAMSRHCVVMGFCPGFKMANVRGLTPEQARDLGWGVYAKMIFLLERKVVHGDLNEYNVIV